MARLAKYSNSILVVDSDGGLVPAEGATVQVYAPDTTTARTIYSDSSGTIAVSLPITLGADGMLQFYVRSQDRTFDINVVDGAAPLPQFTTFTISDVSASHDDNVFYASEYSTFQACINAATDGTKIVLDEDVTISSTLTISAAGITIEGLNRGIIITLSLNANCDVFDIAGTRLTFRNFTVDGNAANQNGAGPYYGLDVSGAYDVLMEDLFITNVKGDGVRINGLQDSTLRRVNSFSNYGHGFSSDSSGTGARIVFQDTQASTNGVSTGTFTRRNGYHFEPPLNDMLFDSAQARTNPEEGFAFVGTSTVATIKRIKLDGCYAIANGGTTREGLLVRMAGVSGTIISEFQVNGGQFSDNGLDGIHLSAPDLTNPGTASRIMNFTIDSPVCARNGRHGIYLEGRISYGTITSPVIYQYAQTTAGSFGIKLVGALESNNLDDVGDETRCRWVSIVGPVITYESGAGALDAIKLFEGTKHCTIRDVIANGQSFLSARDIGKYNVIQGMRVAGTSSANGGFPAWPITTSSDYGASQYGGFWIVGRTRTVSTTETRVGSNRTTANTRVLSLVPLDATAADQLMGAGASGWWHKLAANVVGTATGAGGASANMGYLTIYTVGAAGAYSTTGEFAVFCAEAFA